MGDDQDSVTLTRSDAETVRDALRAFVDLDTIEKEAVDRVIDLQDLASKIMDSALGDAPHE